MVAIPRRSAAQRSLPDPVPADTRAAAGVSRVSSGEQVGLYIRRLIFEGELRQGRRVPQDAIARALGVSRIPVREALIGLEREGWVTIIPHRGAFVNALDESAVRDHYELYGLIYGFAARRATERQGPQLADRLAPVQRRIATAADDDALYDATLTFHRLVVDAASSPRLRSLLRRMTGIVPGNFFELVVGAAQVEKQGTAAIVRAVRGGDSERAAGEYTRMLRRQGDLVVALFRSRGMFDEQSRSESG